jgi:hypothetical protein
LAVGAYIGVIRTSAPSERNTSSNTPSEQRGPVANEELQWPMPEHQQVAGLLGSPGAVRVGGHAGQVDRRVSSSMRNST